MEVVKIRARKFNVVCEVANHTTHSLMRVENSVNVEFDSDNLFEYAELFGYDSMKKEILHTLGESVKKICEETGVILYSTFMLKDDENTPLFIYVAYPHYNELQCGAWDKDKAEFDLQKRFEVANSSDWCDIIEEIAKQVSSGMFDVIEEKFFELK